MIEELGDKRAAHALHENNLRRARASGNARMEALTLNNLAVWARAEGRYDDALRMHTESFRIARDLDDPVELADGVSRFARALAEAGHARLATQLLSCSEGLCEEIGFRRSWFDERNEETLALARSKLDERDFEEAWARGRELTADEAAALAVKKIAD
jgi:Tetratricopeptide repeat